MANIANDENTITLEENHYLYQKVLLAVGTSREEEVLRPEGRCCLHYL